MIMIYDKYYEYLWILMLTWLIELIPCRIVWQSCLRSAPVVLTEGAIRHLWTCVCLALKPLRFFSQSFWKSSPAVVEKATKLIETNPFLNSVGSNIVPLRWSCNRLLWKILKLEFVLWFLNIFDTFTKVCRFLQVDMPILRYGQERFAQRLES